MQVSSHTHDTQTQIYALIRPSYRAFFRRQSRADVQRSREQSLGHRPPPACPLIPFGPIPSCQQQWQQSLPRSGCPWPDCTSRAWLHSHGWRGTDQRQQQQRHFHWVGHRVASSWVRKDTLPCQSVRNMLLIKGSSMCLSSPIAHQSSKPDVFCFKKSFSTSFLAIKLHLLERASILRTMMYRVTIFHHHSTDDNDLVIFRGPELLMDNSSEFHQQREKKKEGV